MKTWKYEIFEEYCNSEICKSYIIYGIDVYENGALKNAIHFVTKDLEKVKALTKKLNQCQVSPIHLNDIIEDEIGDRYHAHYFG